MRTFGTLAALLMIFAGLVLGGRAVVGFQQDVIYDTIQWPVLQPLPFLASPRVPATTGGMHLPDGVLFEGVPKAGVAWPCTDDAEATQICYLNADGSKPEKFLAVDMAEKHPELVFIIKKGAVK